MPRIREEQARQAALVSHVVSDVLSDPQMGALALAKSKLAIASFSRAQEFEADGIGVGISARAGFDPFGASRFLTDMQRNADAQGSGRRRQSGIAAVDFLSAHPSTPDRVKNALANARQFSAPGTGERDRNEYLADLDGMVYGEDPSEGFVRGRRFLHPKLGFTFLAPPGFTPRQHRAGGARPQRRRRRGDAARRRERAGRAVAARLSEVGLDGECRSGERRRNSPSTASRRRPRPRSGEHWSFRLFAVRFGSDVYRFIFAAKTMTAAVDRSFRDSILSFRRMSLKESSRSSRCI